MWKYVRLKDKNLWRITTHYLLRNLIAQSSRLLSFYDLGYALEHFDDLIEETQWSARVV
jgi:hypothetical protein